MVRMQAQLRCDTASRRYVYLATLDPAYIAAVDIADQRQCILRNLAGFSPRSECLPNAFANLSMTVSILLRRHYPAFADIRATDYSPHFWMFAALVTH